MSGKVKHTYIHKCIIDISSFQEELNNTCCSTGCYFKNRVVESSHEMQICFFFNFSALFCQMYLFEVARIFFAQYLSRQLSFISSTSNGYDSVSSPLATIAKETSPFNTDMQLINPNNLLS